MIVGETLQQLTRWVNSGETLLLNQNPVSYSVVILCFQLTHQQLLELERQLFPLLLFSILYGW